MTQSEASWRYLRPFPISYPLQLRCLREQGVARRIHLQRRSIYLLNVLEPSDVEEDVKVRQQALHHVPYTMIAHDGKTPNPESTDKDELGADCKGLEDV